MNPSPAGCPRFSRSTPHGRRAGLLAACLLVLLAACAAPSPAPVTDTAADAAAGPEEAAADAADEGGGESDDAGDGADPATGETRYAPFPADTLYALLVAEFAARRGRFQLAMDTYLEQARATRDPGVAARATQMARYLNAGDKLLDAALLWAEVDPQNPEARFVAASELARTGKPVEAFEQMRALHATGKPTRFAAVAAGALELPEADRRAMLEGLDALPPGNTVDVQLARALLLQGLDDNRAALKALRVVYREDPANYQAVLIEAQIHQNEGDLDKAFARIDTALAARPDDDALRLQYARMLAKTDMRRAAAQFGELVRRHPDDGQLRITLALALRETGDYAAMRTQLEQLLAQDSLASTAHFYLGEDDERGDNIDRAIEHYLAVNPSPMFGPAISRAGNLIGSRRGLPALGEAMERLRMRWPEQALQLQVLESDLRAELGDLAGADALLGAALAEKPLEPALLYARSMISEKRGDVPAMERDLRTMLRLDPENALALNALGYSLANLTDRYQEALELISRALAKKPDDAAILDSMGWVHYRLGDHAKALGYLRDAYSRFPDPEVAAHLGEVLWASGEQKEALAIWGKALEGDPDNKLVRGTAERLGARLPPAGDKRGD